MTVAPDDTLYELLPEVYRVRDATEPGRPLRTLLRAIAGQLDELTADIAAVYANWFIETCDGDHVPLLAELVGVSLGRALPTSPHAASAGVDAIWRRRQVADGIGDRRRRGTASVLEQLAVDATGWPVRVLDPLAGALATPTARFPGLAPRPALDVSAMDALSLLASPLSSTARLVDVRRLGSRRTPGTNSATGVMVWLWRLIADRVTRAPARPLAQDGHYTFDQLGRELPLAVIPAGDVPAAPVSALDVPIPITRAALALRLEDYYGPGRSICVYEGSEPVSRSRIVVGDARNLRGRLDEGQVCVDPVRGRIAFPTRYPPQDDVLVTCARLGVGAIGGGSYPRPRAPAADPVYRVGARAIGTHRTIAHALTAWRRAGATAAVIEIVDDGVYREPLDIRLAGGESLTIQAAPGRRPVLIPSEGDGGRPDRLRILGPPPDDEAAGDDASPPPPSLRLDGIWVARHSLELHGVLGTVALRHCTLVPPERAAAGGEPPRRPSLVVRGTVASLELDACVSGRIEAEGRETGTEPVRCRVADSVLDAGDPDEPAVAGADDRPAWLSLSLERVTVLGAVYVHAVTLVQDTLLTGPLVCERRQAGEVRHSYLPPASRTPRRTQCQPDVALARVDEAVALGTLDPGRRARRVAETTARLMPRFDALRFGEPAYARLAPSAAAALRYGAHDEGELGAYHDRWEPVRIADLRSALADYVPVGIDIDIRLAT